MMHPPYKLVRPRRLALQQGQSIVVALLVLLLLGFLGGLFASIVTRNLRSAARSGRVQNADFYAQAGLRFADDQLTHSTDGADWRPPLQFQLASASLPTGRALTRYNAYLTANPTFAAPAAQDPDRVFLEQGFARYNIGGGRFLLRLTYQPVPGSGGADPRGRYIKIESVGRDGTVDPQDPTTYQNAPVTRLNATLVEYKAIGITDYARFETNPDKRSDIMALGVASSMYNNEIVTPGAYDFVSVTGAPPTVADPAAIRPYPVVTEYGAPYAYIASTATPGPTTTVQPNPDDPFAAPGTGVGTPGGGAIHANGTVRFFGVNHFYLNNNVQADSTGTLGETLEVGGDLLLDSYDPANAANLNTAQIAAVVLNPPLTGAIPATSYVGPSNDSNAPFSTHQGLARDAGTSPDANGLPRSVGRLEPPTLDATDPVTNLSRYKALTLNSPARTDTLTGTAVTSANAGAAGFGRFLYINNANDVQAESSKVLGGFTLVDEWLHRAGPGESVSGGRDPWTANFYRPPGVEIVLGRQRVNVAATGGGGFTSKTFYGVRLVRSDVDGAGQPVYWQTPDTGGVLGAGNSGTMVASYDDLYASNDQGVAPTTTAALANPNNDVVIYAEGNVRVRGAASAAPADLSEPTDAVGAGAGSVNDNDHLPRHITIVTNGTAYIDGSLVRGNPDSSVSVLAHDYVCVNTTQFLAGAQMDQDLAGTQPPGAFTGDPSLRALDFGLSDQVLLQEFNGVKGTPALYISGGPGAAGATQADFDVLDPRTGFQAGSATLLPFQSPVAQPQFSSTDLSLNNLAHITIPLTTVSFGTTPSQFNQLAVRRTPVPSTPLVTFDPTATQDFLLERAAILPMDLKIEATLFAQTRSFFVIPGEWFNTAADDNIEAFAKDAAHARSGTDATQLPAARFPFYGQPIDMKITVYGSVSEARPADISAQTAWMLKWGWIPQWHGSTFTLSNAAEHETAGGGHTAADPTSGNPIPAIGLALVYNPLAAYPYSQSMGGYYLRTDLYGRPLPSAPKLPVCAGLLYAGQSLDPSLL